MTRCTLSSGVLAGSAEYLRPAITEPGAQVALSLSPLILETAPAEPCSENLTVLIRTSLVIFFPLESIQRGQISWIWRVGWFPTHVLSQAGRSDREV